MGEAIKYLAHSEPYLASVLKEFPIVYTRDVDAAVMDGTFFVNPGENVQYWSSGYDLEQHLQDAVLADLTDEVGTPKAPFEFEVSSEVIAANANGLMPAVFEVLTVVRSWHKSYRFSYFRYSVTLNFGAETLVSAQKLWQPLAHRPRIRALLEVRKPDKFRRTSGPPRFLSQSAELSSSRQGRWQHVAIVQGVVARTLAAACDLGEAEAVFDRALAEQNLRVQTVGRHRGFDIYHTDEGYYWNKGGPSKSMSEIRREIAAYHFEMGRQRTRERLAAIKRES